MAGTQSEKHGSTVKTTVNMESSERGIVVRLGSAAWTPAATGQAPVLRRDLPGQAQVLREDVRGQAQALCEDPLAPVDEAQEPVPQLDAGVAAPDRRVQPGQPQRPPLGKSHSVGDSFRTGLAFGLALGCAGLILFHQMPAVSSPRAVSGTAWPSATLAGPQLTVPAVHFFALQAGVYGSAVAADAAAKRLNTHGTEATVVPMPGGRLDVLTAVADLPTDLASVQSRLKRQNVAIKEVTLSTPAQTIPTLSSVTRAEATAVDKWLAAQMSAVKALTAVLADGEPAQDAKVALAMAQSLEPKAAVLKATGYGSALEAIAVSTATAGDLAFRQHQSTRALGEVMKAVGLFDSLEQAP